MLRRKHVFCMAVRTLRVVNPASLERTLRLSFGHEKEQTLRSRTFHNVIQERTLLRP